jgi:ribosomal protein S18 acetylase RimI-like enzyme
MTEATDTLRVVPADAARWDDVVTVMGTRGDPSWCWCQFFHLPNKDWSASSTPERRAALQQQVYGAGPAPGVLAYRGDEPAGWCQVGPKPSFARLDTAVVSRPSADRPDPEALWSVTCFVVPVGHRRRGVASALLAGAVDLARAEGAAAVEGYPMETGGARRSSADLYHGTVSMFEQAGFTEVRRPRPGRVVMRLSLR